MSLILKGQTSELILTRFGTLAMNDEGMATLSREYSCATTFEATADSMLTVDSAPLNYTLPGGVYNLVCTSVNKSRENGITTYQVNYIGLTTQVFKTLYGTSILSYSESIITGSGTDTYSVTYVAPTVTRYSVSDSGGTIPSTPQSNYNIRILDSYKNGALNLDRGFTTQWLLTNLRSTQYGNYFVIEATGTRMIAE